VGPTGTSSHHDVAVGMVEGRQLLAWTSHLALVVAAAAMPHLPPPPHAMSRHLQHMPGQPYPSNLLLLSRSLLHRTPSYMGV
jgi:hypothetical protein